MNELKMKRMLAALEAGKTFIVFNNEMDMSQLTPKKKEKK